MERNDIFINMRNKIKRDLSEFIDEAVEDICSNAEKVCDAIEQEIKTVRETELNKGDPEDVMKVQNVVNNAKTIVDKIQRDANRA